MLRFTTPVFPSHDEENKDKAWIKKFAKACWEDFNSINTNSFYKGRVRYAEIDKYMIGEQDANQYLDKLDIDTANKDKQWLKVSKKILPIVPKYRRMTTSTLKKNIYNTEIKAIDPTSVEEATEYYAQNKARIIIKEEAKKQGVDVSELIPEPDGSFQNEEDLDLYMEYSYKDRIAIEAEQAIKVILNNNKYASLRDVAIDRLHDHGFIGYKDCFDQNGDISIKYVPAQNAIVSRCMYPDFSDAFYMGVVHDLTVSDLVEIDTEREIGPEDMKSIYEMINQNSSVRFNQESQVNPDNYENQRIQVLDLEFFSKKKMVVEKGLDRNGNPTVSKGYKVREKRKKNEYITKEYKVIYECKWVVGTNVYFGCRLQTNMKRPKSNISDVNFSYHFYAPMLINMETKSMGENYIPIADQLQLTWMKYQDVVIRARKRGIAIEIGALENIPLGKAGKKFTPMDGIDFYNKSGNVVYRRTDKEGKNSSYKPIEELQNGLGSEAQVYFAEIQNNISLLQQLSGYNEITDGSTPDSRTLNGVAKLASESTNNSIDFMKRAERSVFESLSYGLLIRVQDSAASGRLEGYVNALGKNSIEFFKLSPEVGARELGLMITDSPSEYQKEAMNKRIEIALQKEQITIADAHAIESIDNIKHAAAILAIRVQKNLEEKQRIALQNQEMNAKAQQESLQMASQLKTKEIQEEGNSRAMLIELEKKSKLEQLDREWGYRLQEKEMEVSGRITQKTKESRSKDYASDLKRETDKEKLEAENKQPEMA